MAITSKTDNPSYKDSKKLVITVQLMKLCI